MFAELFIHVFPKGLAFVERLEFAGQQSLGLPAPPPKHDSKDWDWRQARQAWEDGGRQGFIEVRIDFSEASHGLRDGPPPLGFACGTAALPGFSSDSVVASLMAFKPRTAS